MAQEAARSIVVLRVADRFEAHSPEGAFLGRVEAASANAMGPTLTVIGSPFLDVSSLTRTDSASVGTGAWRAFMSAVTHDSVSRYLVYGKDIAPMSVPSSLTAHFWVPPWVAPRKVRVAASFFRDGVPVVNSNLDTVFASGGYQVYTFQFPTVAGQVNQIVFWDSYFHGDRGSMVKFLDQVVAGGVTLEDGEVSGGDMTPPGIPTGVTLTATSATSADARGTSPSDPDVGSVVFELDTSPGFTNPVRVTGFATSGAQVVNTFLNLAPSTLYYLRMAARDVSGNQGTFSTVDTTLTYASSGGGTFPNAPTGFSVTGVSASSVAMVFAHGAGATQTEVQLAEGLTFGTSYLVKMVPAFPGSPELVVFSGLRENRIYAGRARSVNQDGLSPYAPQDTGRTFVVVTGVEKWSEAPHAFALHGNFPNPFNPTTMIRYDVGEEAVVTITVYDVLGRTMDELLLRELRGPGRYDVTWNASAHPSGIYFCRMEAGTFVATTKMLLVR